MAQIVLTRENAADYMRTQTDLFPADAVINVYQVGDGTLEEDGDGYVNFVFRVWDDERSFVLKQARPYFKKFAEMGDMRECPLERNSMEVDILRIRGAVCPEHIPKLYHVDAANNVFVMEDLSHLRIMRFALNDMHMYKNFPRQMAEYFAACNFFTSLEYLPDETFRGLEVRFINPKMRAVMESFIFIPPQGDRLPENPDPDERKLGVFYFSRPKILKEMIRMRNIFMRRTECLIHGDLHTSNIFLDDDTMKVFDMEYTIMGPEAHDMGYLTANCISEYAAFHFRQEFDEQERARFRVYLITKLHDIVACYNNRYTELFNQYAKPLYKDIEGYCAEKLQNFFFEMIGFAACSNISRTGGMMGYPDFDVIQDKTERIHAKAMSMLISATILENHDDIRDAATFLGTIITCADKYMQSIGRKKLPDFRPEML